VRATNLAIELQRFFDATFLCELHVSEAAKLSLVVSDNADRLQRATRAERLHKGTS